MTQIVFGQVLFMGRCNFLPIYAVTLRLVFFGEIIFAVVRGHEVNEGFCDFSIIRTLAPQIFRYGQ